MTKEISIILIDSKSDLEIIEKTTDEREVDHLWLAKFFAHLFIDTIVLLGSVEHDMRRPQQSRLFARVKKIRR